MFVSNFLMDLFALLLLFFFFFNSFFVLVNVPSKETVLFHGPRWKNACDCPGEDLLQVRNAFIVS